MKLETLHQLFLESSGVCTDTRKINQGCLFFALKGDNFNGNEFTQDALDKGAIAVVIDEKKYDSNLGKTILCANVLNQLQELAAYHRKYLKLPIIALTGSNGKTTTKELINQVLKKKYVTTATVGNLNNHIGVPLTLLSMNKDTQIGIVEMGANHHKEIEKLCEIATPDFGYITNFGKAHLEGFGSVEGVIEAKSELYEHLHSNHKIAFVNGQDPIQMSRSKDLHQIVFGKDQPEYSIKLENAASTVSANFNGLSIQSNLIGLYNFNNIAAAIAIGHYFGVSSEKIKMAIEEFIPTNNRSQLLEKGTNKIVMDAYNANPTSMMAALENFNQAEGINKVLFLGDMFELGTVAKIEHQNIVNYLSENHIGKTYLVGSNFFKTEGNAEHICKFNTFEDLKNAIKSSSPENSFILIKGSRGMALERILDLL